MRAGNLVAGLVLFTCATLGWIAFSDFYQGFATKTVAEQMVKIEPIEQPAKTSRWKKAPQPPEPEPAVQEPQQLSFLEWLRSRF